MNIGIRFHDLEQKSFGERVQIVREQGFGCVHLALYKAFDDFPGPTALTPGLAFSLKKEFSENGVDVAVLGCYLNLLHPDPAALRDIQASYRAHLRFAGWLGSGVVGTETGCPNAQYRFEPACHTEECFDQFVRNLAPVVEDAERLGVAFAIEPVYSHCIHTVRRARRLLDIMASPSLQIIFDPVNLLSVENYRDRAAIMEEGLELLGDHIAVVHAKDFVAEEGRLRTVAAGFGEMDYGPLMRFIKAKKPHIHVTLEDAKPPEAVQARQNMQRVFAEA